jgi:Ca2+-binding EF-hand superfamily protein
VEQLKKLLTDLSTQYHPDVTPTDDETKYILTQCDASKNGCIDVSEVENVLFLWKTYLSLRPAINTVYDEFDTDKSGKLSADQLRAFMNQEKARLWPGEEKVADEDVAWLLEKADILKDGQIGRIEFVWCSALWTGELTARKHSAEAASQKNSKACILL